MTNLVCDFCNDPDPSWVYPTEDFDIHQDLGIGILHHQLIGAWSACNSCHDLIEVQQYLELSIRSMQKLLEKHPEMDKSKEEILQYLRSLHLYFLTNRKVDRAYKFG